MRRIALAIFSVLMLAAGVALYFAEANQGWTEFLSGVFIKVGTVLALYWLAYDQVMRLVSRIPPWMIGLGLLTVGILVVRPKAVIFLAPVLAIMAVVQFIGWLFKPLPTNHPPDNKAAKTTKQPQK